MKTKLKLGIFFISSLMIAGTTSANDDVIRYFNESVGGGGGEPAVQREIQADEATAARLAPGADLDLWCRGPVARTSVQCVNRAAAVRAAADGSVDIVGAVQEIQADAAATAGTSVDIVGAAQEIQAADAAAAASQRDLSQLPLDEMTCDGRAKAVGDKWAPQQEAFNFSSFTNSVSADGQTLKQLGNRGNGYFFYSQLLVSCEDQGTKPWDEFKDKLLSANNAAWDSSWALKIRDVVGLQNQAGNSSSNSIFAGVDAFEAEEKAFLKECVKADAPLNRSALMATGNIKVKAMFDKIDKIATNGLRQLAEHRIFLEKCEALVHMTDKSDFEAEYPTVGRSSKTVKVSFDQKVKCEAYGPETQDFKACSNFIDTYDASMVAKTAINAGQGIHYQGQSMDRQADMARQGQTGGVDHRGALGMQKDDIKDRANYATQNAALDSAKLATLFGILQTVPTRSSLAESCQSSFNSKLPNITARLHDRHTKSVAALLKSIGLPSTHQPVPDAANPFTGDIMPKQDGLQIVTTDGGICAHVASLRSGNRRGGNGGEDTSSLIMNQGMRSMAKRILAETAVQAAASFAAAGMLNSQAKKIDDLIKRIDGYDPSDDFVAPSTDLMAGPCAFDPSQPGCGGQFGNGTTAVGFGGTTLSFDGGGFGSSGTMINADEGYDNATGDRTATADRSGASMPVGSIIQGVDKKSGMIDSPQGAASVKSSAAGRSGSGGSGGASAVGSTGGGGSGAQGQQAARGGQAGGGKQISYAGSSIGRLSGGRGVGRKPASKDDGKNPFANMFKQGGPSNNTLNFRGPAGINGNKGSNIFDQISSRYQVVQTKKLLLEYEQKE